MDPDKIHRTCLLLTKSILSLSLGLFGMLVAFDNVVAYDLNWQFVRHVLSLDSMEPFFNNVAIQQRAITDMLSQKIVYGLIIAGECLFGVLCALGGLLMLLGMFKTDRSYPTYGKILTTLGCLIGILIWYTGFAVIGGEYFSMWANTWNGQMKAYTFSGFILLSLLFISQKD